MKTYIATNGEIIAPATYGVDVFDPADPPRAEVTNPDGVVIEPAYSGTLLHAADDEVPIEERFTPEFVATLREYDPIAEPNPPELQPPPVPPVTAAQALATRDALKAYATSMIDPLADAVEMDEATPAEVAALKAWKQYRLALSRIEQQPGFPASVEWPVAPN